MEGLEQVEMNKSMPASWQHDKALGDCMIQLYENKLWTDVKFRCSNHDEHERIHAHKIVLAARSPVFQAKFFGPCAEANEEIVLDDIEDETLDLFLRFIYQDKVTLTEEIAASVLETAHFYQVTNLVSYCADFLASCITHQNVCDILSLARRYEVVSLCKSCCNFIDDNAERVMESESFLKLSEDTLTYIMKGDTFFAEEVDIFKKAEEWAHKKIEESNLDKHGQNIRKVLGSSFFHLRLPTMTSENLLNCTRRKGYLSAEEYEDLVDFINKTPDTTVESNSCIRRLPTKELLYFTDVENGEINVNTNVLRDEIKTIFQVTVSRDVKVNTVELAEINHYLKFDRTLYDSIVSEYSTFNGDNFYSFYREFNTKVIQINNYNRIKILQSRSGQDLSDGVDIVISGKLKVTCHSYNKEMAAGNIKEEEIAIVQSDEIPNEPSSSDDDVHTDISDDSDGDFDDLDLIFEQEIEMISTNKTQYIINLKEPLILEVSRSPYKFTLNLEYKNVISNNVQMKTVVCSKHILTNSSFQVENIEGNFCGIRSLCFENISNRD